MSNLKLLDVVCLPVCSPQGHILILAGFGNLRGQMEVWDVKNYKQVRGKHLRREGGGGSKSNR